MKAELLARSPLLALPLFALFLFIVVFAGIFIITMQKRAPAYASLARMPLDDEGERPCPPKNATKLTNGEQEGDLR